MTAVPDDRRLAVEIAIMAGGVHAFGDPFGPLGPDMAPDRRHALEVILEGGWAHITGRSAAGWGMAITDAGWALAITPAGRRALGDLVAGSRLEDVSEIRNTVAQLVGELIRVSAGRVALPGELFPRDPGDDPDDVADWEIVEQLVADGRAYLHGPREDPFGWPVVLARPDDQGAPP